MEMGCLWRAIYDWRGMDCVGSGLPDRLPSDLKLTIQNMNIFNKKILLSVAVATMLLHGGGVYGKTNITHISASCSAEYAGATQSAGIPAGAKIITSYSDKRRNTVYYQYNERIFCYDRTRRRTKEMQFSYGYVKIKNIYTSPLHSRIFVVLDMGNKSYNPVVDGLQLWVINSFNRRCSKVGEGFRVRKGKDGMIVNKKKKCKKSNEHKERKKKKNRENK